MSWNVNISDHQAVFITTPKIKSTPKIKVKTEFTGRSYINFGENVFCENLLGHDWDHLYVLGDVSIAWNYSISDAILTTDLMCPLRSFKIKNLKGP